MPLGSRLPLWATGDSCGRTGRGRGIARRLKPGVHVGGLGLSVLDGRRTVVWEGQSQPGLEGTPIKS